MKEPQHPGEVIKQILFDTGLLAKDYAEHDLYPTFKGQSLSKLAKDVDILKGTLGKLIRCEQDLTAAICVKLERVINDKNVFDSEKLMDMQKDLDLFVARQEIKS